MLIHECMAFITFSFAFFCVFLLLGALLEFIEIRNIVRSRCNSTVLILVFLHRFTFLRIFKFDANPNEFDRGLLDNVLFW